MIILVIEIFVETEALSDVIVVLSVAQSRICLL